MAILEMMMPAYVAAGGGAVPAFVNVGTLGSSGNAITMGQPASPQANDIWVMVVQTSNQSITTPTNATAGTWAEIATQTGTGTAATANSNRLGFFWHRWTTTTGNVTVADSGDHQLARIAAYRGCRTSGNPWNTVGTMANAVFDGINVIRPAAITTTVNNTLVLIAVAHSQDVADSQHFLATTLGSQLTSLTERIDNTLATGTGGGIGLADATMATAGTLVTTAGIYDIGYQAGTTSSNTTCCLVALEPT